MLRRARTKVNMFGLALIAGIAVSCSGSGNGQADSASSSTEPLASVSEATAP